jgi:alkanesulfonate monooxygenase SsuD/methylene tetrahydromethanopterin reductase-like flavin-dependent oxidoreductase (luciferase family)
MWNAMGTAEEFAPKDEVLRRHCDEMGRDEAEIERSVGCTLLIRRDQTEAERAWARILAANGTIPDEVEHTWVGTPEQIAERLGSYLAIGFRTVIVELPAPYEETMERLAGEVRPMLSGIGMGTEPRTRG